MEQKKKQIETDTDELGFKLFNQTPPPKVRMEPPFGDKEKTSASGSKDKEKTSASGLKDQEKTGSSKQHITGSPPKTEFSHVSPVKQYFDQNFQVLLEDNRRRDHTLHNLFQEMSQTIGTMFDVTVTRITDKNRHQSPPPRNRHTEHREERRENRHEEENRRDENRREEEERRHRERRENRHEEEERRENRHEEERRHREEGHGWYHYRHRDHEEEARGHVPQMEQMIQQALNRLGLNTNRAEIPRFVSPFPQVVQEAEIPRGVKTPKVTRFAVEPSESTVEHVARYLTEIGDLARDEALKMKLFPSSLTKEAFTWFSRLPPDSIHRWWHLERAFHEQFHKEETRTSMLDLCGIRKAPEETVEQYVNTGSGN